MAILRSKPDACDDLGGISHTTLWQLVRDGHLTQVNIGRRSFITAESITKYVDSLTAAAG